MFKQILSLFLLGAVSVLSLSVFAADAKAADKSPQSQLGFSEILLQASAKANQYCHSKGYRCAIAVYDSFGEPLLVLRNPDGMPLNISIAESKAYTSAMLDVSTDDFQAFTAKGKPYYGIRRLNDGRTPGFIGIRGGLPIRLPGGYIVGVGISTSRPNEQDLMSTDLTIDQTVARLFKNTVTHLVKTQQPILNLATYKMDKSGKTSGMNLLIDAFSSTDHFCHQMGMWCQQAVVSNSGLVEGLLNSPDGSFRGMDWASYKAHMATFISQNAIFPYLNQFDDSGRLALYGLTDIGVSTFEYKPGPYDPAAFRSHQTISFKYLYQYLSKHSNPVNGALHWTKPFPVLKSLLTSLHKEEQVAHQPVRVSRDYIKSIDVPRLTLKKTRLATYHAVLFCQKHHIVCSVGFLNRNGEYRFEFRMENDLSQGLKQAEGNAIVALSIRDSLGVLKNVTPANSPHYQSYARVITHDSHYILTNGGAPIKLGSHFLGSIGVSYQGYLKGFTAEKLALNVRAYLLKLYHDPKFEAAQEAKFEAQISKRTKDFDLAMLGASLNASRACLKYKIACSVSVVNLEGSLFLDFLQNKAADVNAIVSHARALSTGITAFKYEARPTDALRVQMENLDGYNFLARNPTLPLGPSAYPLVIKGAFSGGIGVSSSLVGASPIYWQRYNRIVAKGLNDFMNNHFIVPKGDCPSGAFECSDLFYQIDA